MLLRKINPQSQLIGRNILFRTVLVENEALSLRDLVGLLSKYFLQNRFDQKSIKGLQGLPLPISEIELAYFIDFKSQLV